MTNNKGGRNRFHVTLSAERPSHFGLWNAPLERGLNSLYLPDGIMHTAQQQCNITNGRLP